MIAEGERIAWSVAAGVIVAVGDGSTRNGDRLLIVKCDDGVTRPVRESRIVADGLAVTA